MTHICVSNLTIIGSDKGLSPGRRQAIIWTNAGILLIGPLGTNFSEILIQIKIFSFKKMHFKLSSAKWHSFCLGLNLLNKLHFLILLWKPFLMTSKLECFLLINFEILNHTYYIFEQYILLYSIFYISFYIYVCNCSNLVLVWNTICVLGQCRYPVRMGINKTDK